MSRDRFMPRPLSDRAGEPFPSAEEAWLWFSRCQLARLDGVRFTANAGEVARPCDPDDIYRAVSRLYRGKRLHARHIDVLGRYGRRLTPPDPWGGDEPVAAHLWDEALDRLTTVLRIKGIVR